MQTFVKEVDGLIDLYVDGEVISTTEEHPFWVVDKGWVEASDLRVGDLLQTEDGVIVDIDGIEEREGEFEVYNFEVEDFHTYFVSDLEILVHNANCGQPNVSDGYDPDSFRGEWPPTGGDTRPPTIMGKRTSDGGVELSDVYRRGNPRGTGGQMIAETLKGAGVPQPTRIRITDIQEGTNPPTAQALQSGAGPEGTPLGNALNNAIEELGGTPGPWTFGKYREKLWIERTITY